MSRLLALVSISCVIVSPIDSITHKLTDYIRCGGALPVLVNAVIKQLGFILSLLQKTGQTAGSRDGGITIDRVRDICVLVEESFFSMVGSFFTFPQFTYGDSSAHSVVAVLSQLSKLSACCVCCQFSDLDSIDAYVRIVMGGLSSEAMPFIQNQQGIRLAVACGLLSMDNDERSVDRETADHKTFYVYVWFYTSLLMPLVVWIRRRAQAKVNCDTAQGTEVEDEGNNKRLAMLCASLFALLCDDRSHILSMHVSYEDEHLFSAGPVSHVELSSLGMHGKLLAILYGIMAQWEPAWLTATAVWSRGLHSSMPAVDSSPLAGTIRNTLLDAFVSHVNDHSSSVCCCSKLKHRIFYFLSAMGRIGEERERTMKFDVNNVVEYRTGANAIGGSASARVRGHIKSITSRIEVNPWNLVWTCEQSSQSRLESDSGVQVVPTVMPYNDDDAVLTAASISGRDTCPLPFWLQGSKKLPSSAMWQLENGTTVMQ